MPAGQAALAVAFHGVGRHGDDRQVAARVASRSRGWPAVASKPSISGICTSINTRSKGSRLQAASACFAVAGDHDGVPPLLQQADRQLAG